MRSEDDDYRHVAGDKHIEKSTAVANDRRPRLPLLPQNSPLKMRVGCGGGLRTAQILFTAGS